MMKTIARNGHKTFYASPSRSPLTKDIGDTGLQPVWGYIHDDFLSEWRGQEKVKRVKEMVSNSAAVGAMRFAIEMALRGIDWPVISLEGERDPRIELVENSIDNLTHSWNDHISDAVLMVFYGWSMFTNKYERQGNQLLLRKLKMLGHDTVQNWLFEDDGGLLGLQQWPHLWPMPIPIERMLIYRTRKTLGNPEGESLLRPSWPSWYYAKNIAQIEAIGIERNLAGMPVITPPMGADMDGEDGDKAELIVRNVRNDEQSGVVLPPPTGDGDHYRWKFELMAPSSTGKVTDTDMVISRYEKRILMTTLTQFLMLGMDNVGALATMEGGTDFFTMAVNTLADIVSETFTKYQIERLLMLNGLNPKGVMLTHSPAGDIDINVIGQFLQQVGDKITWTPDDEVMIRGLARLPEKSAEDLAMLQEEQQQRKDERVRAMQESMRQAGQREEPDNERDDNAAELYAVDPQQDMSRYETRFQREMKRYLADQEQAVIRAARRL